MAFRALVFALTFSVSFAAGVFSAHAQEDMERQCRIEVIDQQCARVSQQECQRILEQCRDFFEERSAELEGTIRTVQQRERSFQSEIQNLTTRIRSLEAQIQRSDVVIRDLSFQIEDLEESITRTTERIKEREGHLAEVLRTVYEQNNRSTLEILLAESTLAGFFDNMVALESLNDRTHQLLLSIKDLKKTLESQRVLVEEEKEKIEREQIAAALAKQEQERSRRQADALFRIAQQERVTYEQYLQEVEEKQRQIRSRLLNLVGASDAPTFGEALDLAQRVQELTGVRTAFLLAIIIQESALGRNVGQCYLADTKSGSSVSIESGKRFSNGIHPRRDLPPFLQITREVGRDPLGTPVSCPLAVGYGGAMGPSQFIPSTWMLYKNGVSQLTGSPADPWNVRDAFLASGLLLKDNGASPRTYSAEWCAAARYFSGRCTSRSDVASYANTVMARANCVQEFITSGTVSSQCDRLLFIP